MTDKTAGVGPVERGVRPDGDLALLMLAQQAELDAGPPYLMSMLNGNTVVGEFQERLALLMRAAVAAERERCAKACRDKAAEWLKRADAGDMPRDTARHAKIAAGQIEAAILRA